MDKFLISKKPITFKINPLITTRFPENTILILEKDYRQFGSYCSKYLKKSVFCFVMKCGISKYPNEIDEETETWSRFTDGKKWGSVNIIMSPSDPDQLENYIKANILQEYIWPNRNDELPN